MSKGLLKALGEEVVRVAPFEAIEIDLKLVWGPPAS